MFLSKLEMGCPSDWTHLNGICYRWFEDLRTQQEAAAECEKLGAQLPMPKSQIEVESLVTSTTDGTK